MDPYCRVCLSCAPIDDAKRRQYRMSQFHDDFYVSINLLRHGRDPLLLRGSDSPNSVSSKWAFRWCPLLLTMDICTSLKIDPFGFLFSIERSSSVTSCTFVVSTHDVYSINLVSSTALSTLQVRLVSICTSKVVGYSPIHDRDASFSLHCLWKIRLYVILTCPSSERSCPQIRLATYLSLYVLDLSIAFRSGIKVLNRLLLCVSCMDSYSSFGFLVPDRLNIFFYFVDSHRQQLRLITRFVSDLYWSSPWWEESLHQRPVLGMCLFQHSSEKLSNSVVPKTCHLQSCDHTRDKLIFVSFILSFILSVTRFLSFISVSVIFCLSWNQQEMSLPSFFVVSSGSRFLPTSAHSQSRVSCLDPWSSDWALSFVCAWNLRIGSVVRESLTLLQVMSAARCAHDDSLSRADLSVHTSILVPFALCRTGSFSRSLMSAPTSQKTSRSCPDPVVPGPLLLSCRSHIESSQCVTIRSLCPCVCIIRVSDHHRTSAGHVSWGMSLYKLDLTLWEASLCSLSQIDWRRV